MQSFTSDRFRGWVSPGLEIPPQLIETPEGEIGLPEATLLTENRARKIWMANLRVAGRREACFVSLFLNQSLSRAVRTCYALHAMRLSEKLHQHGFGTFQVLAALKRRGEVLNWNSLLIARPICQVCELPSTGGHDFPVHPIAALTAPLVDELADSLARFHNHGFIHGDLKSRHILIPQPEGSNGHPLYFVDLEKTKHLSYAPGLVHDLFAARDLIQLFASLPSRQGDRDLEEAKQHLLNRYLAAREVSSSRRRRIDGFVNRYRRGDQLQQGETLLRGVLRQLRNKTGLNGSQPTASTPEPAQTEPSEIR